MRTTLLTAVVLFFSLLMTACSSLKINERVAASAELNSAVTYSWKSKALSSKSSAGKSDASFDSNLRQAVDSVLAVKGYKLVSQNSDLIMDYRITVVPGEMTAEQYRNPGLTNQMGASGRIEFNQWGNIQAESEFYERGYLALTAFAPSKPVIWWESVASKILESGESEKHRDRTVRQVVGKMMQPFPNAGKNQ